MTRDSQRDPGLRAHPGDQFDREDPGTDITHKHSQSTDGHRHTRHLFSYTGEQGKLTGRTITVVFTLISMLGEVYVLSLL